MVLLVENAKSVIPKIPLFKYFRFDDPLLLMILMHSLCGNTSSICYTKKGFSKNLNFSIECPRKGFKIAILKGNLNNRNQNRFNAYGDYPLRCPHFGNNFVERKNLS